MKKLLQLEFIKYSYSRIFYAFMGLYIAMIVLLEMFSGKDVMMTNKFPDVWGNLVYSLSFLNFFIGFIILISLTNEYQYKTLRQHIVDGLTKTSYFGAKSLYSLSITVFIAAFVAVSVIISGLYHSPAGNTHGMFENSAVIGDYFVQLLGYMSIAVFMSYLFRNTALAAIIYIMYVLVIEPSLGMALFHNDTNRQFLAYFPKTLFSGLVEPVSTVKLLSHVPFIGLVKGAPEHATRVLMACAYILVLNAGSYFLLRKRDL
jgi:ABC-2 type transport system permease protein